MDQHKENLAGALWISELQKTASIGGTMIRKTLDHFGGIRGIIGAGRKELLEWIGGPPDRIKAMSACFARPDAVRRAADSAAVLSGLYGGIGIRAVSIAEPGYPPQLKEIAGAPAILYYCAADGIGRLGEGCRVAVVGTRNPSSYGSHVTEKIVAGFSGTNIGIISGMARGIDSKAHESALRHGLFTAAVMACGLDIVYPPENRELMRRIVSEGAALSECPPGTRALKTCFPARNRIISGLSDCVAVIEAPLKSGALITADFAAEQGKDVYAVPGSVFSPQSAGTHRLLREGAYLLGDAGDILSNLAGSRYRMLMTLFTAGEQLSSPDIAEVGADGGSPGPANGGEAVSAACLALLCNMEMSAGEIAAELSLPVETVSGILSCEELSGRVECRNGRFVLTDPSKSSIK